MKSQKAFIKIYFAALCLVITLHIGILFWVWQNQFSLVKTHQEEFISVSLKSGTQGNSAPKPALQSMHFPQNKQPTSVHPSAQAEGGVSLSSEVGASSVKGDEALVRRSIFSNPKPHYPLISRRMREQGAVHLRLCIGNHGLVDHILLIKSSGYANLDQSAIAAAKQWRFAAVQTEFDRSPDCYQIPIHFKLES